MRDRFQLLKLSLLTIGLLGLTNMANAEDLKFGLPIKCEINKDCFIQNLPDILNGSDAADPFCQGATYQGHKGIDIRLLSLENIKEDIPVIAAGDGVVKAFRDGEEDRLIVTQEDRNRIKDKECGNGIVLSHVGGYESQYCHLKQNSISIQNGDKVKQGDILGFVGNSGFASFPHVHFTLRKGEQWLDPISGSAPSQSCQLTTKQNTLLDEETAKLFSENSSRLLTSGISGKVIEHIKLVRTGAPEKLKMSDQATVGWAWFINLRKGDQIRFTLEGPKGLLVENTTKPLDRNKASYSAYAGDKSRSIKGEYRLKTELLRDGQVIEESLFVQTLE